MGDCGTGFRPAVRPAGRESDYDSPSTDGARTVSRGAVTQSNSQSQTLGNDANSNFHKDDLPAPSALHLFKPSGLAC